MAMTQSERTKKYQTTKCDAIMLRPSKEKGKMVREAAERAGKTVTAYIMEAVEEKMRKEDVIACQSNK